MAETLAIVLLALVVYLVLRRLPEARLALSLQPVKKTAQGGKVIEPPASLPETVEKRFEKGETEELAEDLLPEIKSALQEADHFYSRGDYRRAEESYIKIAALNPKIALVYSRLGSIYIKQSNFEDAKESLEEAMKLDEKNPAVLSNLGLIYFTQSKYNEALKYYSLAQRNDRGVAARYVSLGLTYMALRQYNKAEQNFRRALNLEPENHDHKKLLEEAKAKRAEHALGSRRR